MLKVVYRKLNDTTIFLFRFTKLHSCTNIHNYENAIIYSTSCSHVYVNKQNVTQKSLKHTIPNIAQLNNVNYAATIRRV